MAFDPLWLEEGHHYDLHCEKRPSTGAGDFTGGGWKLCWHITVSLWMAVDSMANVLVAKGAEPHFVIGGRAGFKHPVVIQLLPLNEAGRSLRHTQVPETNRANVIQVEICAQPPGLGAERDQVDNWSDGRYAALANLAVLIEHRVDIPRKLARSFQNTNRFSGSGFVVVDGHLGHMHAPVANDHSDPTTAFRGDKLLRLMEGAPNKL
jgi:hypothetical protein